MKRLVLVMFMAGFGFTSCNKQQEPVLTKEEIKKKVDSITAIRARESDLRSQRDLQHRMKIEVKVKVDSILNARSQQAAKDTTPAPPVTK